MLSTLLSSLALAAATAPLDTAADTFAPIARPVGIERASPAPDDTTRPRRRAVETSEWYARRLAIHRYASYTMLPLFVTQYVLGDRLLDQKADAAAGRRVGVDDGLRQTHVAVAVGVGTLFTVNTVTGLWNLYDSRHVAQGRGRRTLHTVLMLASDAGFVATGLLGSRATDNAVRDARTHRDVALAAMVPATVGAAIMWFKRD